MMLNVKNEENLINEEFGFIPRNFFFGHSLTDGQLQAKKISISKCFLNALCTTFPFMIVRNIKHFTADHNSQK